MDISDVNNSLESIALDSVQKKAILQLIDLKINNEMKDVIEKLNHVESKLSNEIKVVYWVIGIAMTIILCVVGLIAKK